MTRDLALRLAAAAASGAVCAWLAPPASWTWLHWVAYVPVYWALRDGDWRQNLLVGWTFSAFALAFIFRWLVDTISLYSNIPAPVSAVIIIVGAFVVFGWLYVPSWLTVRPLRRRLGAWWVVAFPCVVVANELLSSFVMIFPWQIGTGHYRATSGIWQLAAVTGVWGLTWLVMFTNSIAAEAMYRHQEGRAVPWRLLGAGVAVWLAIAGWGTWRHGRVEAVLAAAPTLRVAQLQSPHDMLYRMEHQGRRAGLQEWIQRTVRIHPSEIDLVVWPESVVGYLLEKGSVRTLIEEIARRGGYEMIVGAGARAEIADPTTGEITDAQFNSVYFFDHEGEARARYDKMWPLMFGEYLPWWLNWLHDYVQGIGDFRAGTEAVVFEGRKARMSSPICYEAIMGRWCRRWHDVDLIVTGTNDAWFGDTAAPHQHAMLAAIRATELGVPMVRSAYSGVSMVIEPHGRILYETEPFTDVARVVEVRLGRVPTLYGRYGDWFAWLCLAASVLFVLRLRAPGEVDAR